MPYVLCIYLLEAKWHRQNAHANDGIGEGHHVARVCGAHFFYVVHVVTLPNNNLIQFSNYYFLFSLVVSTSNWRMQHLHRCRESRAQQ